MANNDTDLNHDKNNNGNGNMQQKPTKPPFLFAKGAEVEVTSDEEGFRGAWYRATIVQPPQQHQQTPSSPSSSSSSSAPKQQRRRKPALVQYQSLLTDDGSRPLTEIVESMFIRPLPPEGEKGFEVNDVVDAFYNDGWWTGVVCRVLGNDKFLVYYESPPDVFEFEKKNLRPHYDWVDGNWILAKKKNIESSRAMYSSGKAVEVNIDEGYLSDFWLYASVITEIGGKFLVKYKSSTNGDGSGFRKSFVDKQHIRPPHPPSANKAYDLLDKVEALYDSGWRIGVINKILDDRKYDVFFKLTNETKQFGHTELRPHFGWTGGKWITESKVGESSISADNSDMALNPGSSCTIRKIVEEKTPRSRMKKTKTEPSSHSSQLLGPCALTPSNRKEKLSATNNNSTPSRPISATNKNSTPSRYMSTTNNDSTPSRPNRSFTTGRAVTSPRLPKVVPSRKRTPENSLKVTLKISDNQAVDNRGSRISGSSNNSTTQTDSAMVDKKVIENEVGQSNTPASKKRKGRPPKSATKVPKTSPAETEGAQGAVTVPGVQANDDRLTEPDSTPNVVSKTEGERDVNNTTIEKSMESSKQNGEKNSQKRKRGRPCKLNIATTIALEPGLPSKKEELGIDGNAKGNMAIVDDDMPLCVLFAGMQSPMQSPVAAGESRQLPSQACEEYTKTAARQVEPAKGVSNAVVDVSDKSSSDELPFQKCSPVWSTLNSMEVFKVMPQEPHFRPLKRCKVEFREGNAIAMMVSFAGFAERVSKLKCDDPRSSFTTILEGLVDLEKHGFDVNALRDRVIELLKLKDQKIQLQDEGKAAEAKIAEFTHSKSEFDKKLDDIEKQIAALQEEASLLRSKKENESAEIAKLQSQMVAVDVNICNIVSQFEKRVAACLGV